MIDSLAAWILSLFEKKEVKKESPLSHVFKITKHDKSQEVRLVLNKKIQHHYLIQIDGSTRTVEGEVIKYSSLIK